MFGFVIGTVCVLGLIGLVKGARMRRYRRRRCGRSRRRRGNRGARRARVASEILKRRLDIDEDQEGIVDHAVADLRSTLSDLRSTFADSRDELAQALRGDEVDDARLAVVFARHDEELARARRQVVSAVKQIHAVLDDEQRERAADLVGSAGAGWV